MMARRPWPRSREDDERRFLDDANEWRRLFAELLGTFLLVLAAAGSELVNARFGGDAIDAAARATAPGLMVAPVSGASMNTTRSLAPALVLNDWTAWWAYVVGPLAGSAIAVGFAWILRGPGGGSYGKRAAQSELGTGWQPGPIHDGVEPPDPA